MLVKTKKKKLPEPTDNRNKPTKISVVRIVQQTIK